MCVEQQRAEIVAVGAIHLALVLAFGVLLTNMVLRPLAYLLRPVLPDAVPLDTLYEIRLECRTSAVAHLRALLLATISSSPVSLQSIHGEEDVTSDLTRIRADITTPDRNNEVVERIVMRLSIEDAIATLSWSAAQSTLE